MYTAIDDNTGNRISQTVKAFESGLLASKSGGESLAYFPVLSLYKITSDFTVDSTYSNIYSATAKPLKDTGSTIEKNSDADDVTVYFLMVPGDSAPASLKGKNAWTYPFFGRRMIISGGSSPPGVYIGFLVNDLTSGGSAMVDDIESVFGAAVPEYGSGLTVANPFKYTGKAGDITLFMHRKKTNTYILLNIPCLGA